MIKSQSLRLIVAACSMLAACSFRAAETKTPVHNWERIWYPHLELSRDFQTLVLLEPSKDNGLQLTLAFNFPEKEERLIKDKVPKTAVERLHLPDGTIIAGKFEGETAVDSVWHGQVEMKLNCDFPWQRNVLDEAWLEVQLNGRTCARSQGCIETGRRENRRSKTRRRHEKLGRKGYDFGVDAGGISHCSNAWPTQLLHAPATLSSSSKFPSR